MPSLVANDTVTLSEPLALLLFVAILITIDRRRPAWTGVLCGLMLLTATERLSRHPDCGGVSLAISGLAEALLCVLTCLVVVAPWLIRNQIQLGTFRPTTSEGFNLAAVYAPPAIERQAFVDPVFDSYYDRTKFRFDQFDEAQWNDDLSGLAIDSIKKDPTYIADVVRHNLLGFFEIKPHVNEYAEGALSVGDRGDAGIQLITAYNAPAYHRCSAPPADTCADAPDAIPPRRGDAGVSEVATRSIPPKTAFTVASPVPHWDSNPDWADFKSGRRAPLRPRESGSLNTSNRPCRATFSPQLVAPGLNDLFRQTFWVSEEQLVATGHPHQTVEAKAGRHPGMPTPFARWKRSVLARKEIAAGDV